MREGTKEIFLLPQPLIIDIDGMIRHDFVTSKSVMQVISERFRGKRRFDIEDLEEYMDMRRKELGIKKANEAQVTIKDEDKNLSLLPVKPDLQTGVLQYDGQDDSVIPNVRDKARLFEWLKNEILRRMTLVKKHQAKFGDGSNIDPFLEDLVIKYIKEMHTITEKEIKLALEVEESSKLDKLVEERLGLILMMLKNILEKHVDRKKYCDIVNDLRDVFDVYGIDEFK
jgi:hypothetical protein